MGDAPEPVRRALRSRPASIDGPAGRLEAIIDEPAAEPVTAVAVVCHPHPLHQGTMHNKVVHTLSRWFARGGAAAVRFNFRGVGDSAGGFDEGDGETADALAVIDWAVKRNPGVALWLAGFSFGGMVAIRAATESTPAGLITVAPAIRFFGADFRHPACPWLVIQGEADEVVSAADVVRWSRSLDPAPDLRTVSGVGHYFHGALDTIASAADAFMADLTTGRAADAMGSTAC